MEERVSRKKRARTSDSPDGDDKKRGRPRVEKQDESAADRRRTQIRMAQRAYRQRKESTLEELRSRVTELTSTIERMNKTFNQCKDRLYASNLSQTHSLDLHNVSMEFEGLVREACNPQEEYSVEPPKPTHRTSTSSKATEVDQTMALKPKYVPSWLDQGVVASSAKPKPTGAGAWGYTKYTPEPETLPQTINYLHLTSESQGVVPSQEYYQPSQTSLSDSPRYEFSDTFPIPGSLSPPTTYSFQETSIARRLHRACVETVYRLVLDPSRQPAEYERIFRLSLLGRDHAKITASLKAVLDRGTHEDLDFWEAPLIHVGGAGTHYPRRDPFGNLMARNGSVNVGIVGPQTLALLENATRDNISNDMTVQLAGFEGEWLDPYDVQGYFEERGIFIDPTSSFAEAELIEWPHLSRDVSRASPYAAPQTPPATLASPARSTALTDHQAVHLINEVGADLGQRNDFTNMQLSAVGYSDAQSGSWMNFMQPGQSLANTNSQNTLPMNSQKYTSDYLENQLKIAFMSNSQPASPQPRRKKIIIDVAKFVKVMIVSSVCLGRAPGFRRRDVDRAVAISSFDGF